jgi:hypothetical protein
LHGLLILASAGLVTTFKLLPHSISTEICDVLRNPGLGMLSSSSLAFIKLNQILDDNNDISIIVRRSLIPAVHYLQRSLPEECFSAVLGSDLVMLLLSKLQLDPKFLCIELRNSDIFFNSLKKK